MVTCFYDIKSLPDRISLLRLGMLFKKFAYARYEPYSGDLKRSTAQCLDDYGIPLKLSHTIIDIKGKKRLEESTAAQVDKKEKTIQGTEEEYSCDTLLLSVGLIPENELSGGMGIEREFNILFYLA